MSATALYSTTHICEKSRIKPFVAPGEAACNWTNSFQVNVDISF